MVLAASALDRQHDERTNAGYYVLDDCPIAHPCDFLNASVGMNTVGAHHQDVLTFYLRRNGFSDEQINEVQPVVVPPVSAEQASRAFHRLPPSSGTHGCHRDPRARQAVSASAP